MPAAMHIRLLLISLSGLLLSQPPHTLAGVQSNDLRRPILPADRSTPRRQVLAELEVARSGRDLGAVARINATLSGEALETALRTARVWETLRDPETGLIPDSPDKTFWYVSNTGADCLPFLWETYRELDPERAPFWYEVFEIDRRLCGVLPQTVHFRPTRLETGTAYEQLFGGAEYIKDGLVAMAERYGRGPWFARMEEVAQEVNRRAPIATARGPIPGEDTEINGDLLIYLPRLYWATRNPTYLEMAQRIADLYLLDLLPRTGYLPPLYWDFARNRLGRHVHAGLVKYRDHGNELIFGLTELYFLERQLRLPAAERHAAPLRAMLDRILVVGRTPDGLWYDAARISTGEAKPRVIDTWGYLLNALQTFDLTEGTNRYAGEIQRAMRAAAGRKSFEWERQHQDGYADALEGMMYMLPWFDLPECRAWVDDEMEVLYGFQQPDGFVNGTYLDGNFIRTVLLYSRYKAQGARARPWRPDVKLGAVRDPADGSLVLHLEAGQTWAGRLSLDPPMHRDLWGMPLNYPRINAPPQWFPVAAETPFTVEGLNEAPRRVTGADLQAGLPVSLAAGEGRTIRIWFSPP